MTVSNQNLLDEIRANRAEIVANGKLTAALDAHSKNHHYRLDVIEKGNRKVSWAIGTASFSLLSSLTLAALRVFL